MKKPKQKLTSAQKKEKARRKAEFMIVFVNGKQKRVRRPSTVDGINTEEFIAKNADASWLHQNEMWESIVPDPGPTVDITHRNKIHKAEAGIRGCGN